LQEFALQVVQPRWSPLFLAQKAGSCGDQYRPTRSVARWPATCQNPALPFCSVGGLKADFDEFGNGIQNYGNPLCHHRSPKTSSWHRLSE